MDSMPRSGSSSPNDANRHRRRGAQEARVFSSDASSPRARDRNLRGLGLNPSSWSEQTSTSRISHSDMESLESMHQTRQDERNLESVERLKIPKRSMSLERQGITQERPESIAKTNEDIQESITYKTIDEKNVILRENNEMRNTIQSINTDNKALMYIIDELQGKMSEMYSSEELQEIKQKIDQDAQNNKNMLRRIDQRYQLLQDKLTNSEQENLILQIKNKELQYDNRALRCDKQTLNIKNQILQNEKQRLQNTYEELKSKMQKMDQHKQQSTVSDGASSLHGQESSSQSTGQEGTTHHMEQQLQEYLKALGFKLHDDKLSYNYYLAKFLLTEQGKAWLNIYSKRRLKSDNGK